MKRLNEYENGGAPADAVAKDPAERKSYASITSFPCRACGNKMAYSPAHEALYCAYCQATEPVAAALTEAPEYLYDPEARSAAAPDWDQEGLLSVVCPSCGAETTAEPESMTVSCPFCGSHYVGEPKTASPIIKPETMMPFKKTREDAETAYRTWAKKRLYAPEAFRKDPSKLTEMKGVYLPYWTFDVDLDTHYSGQGGRYRTVTYTVTVNGKPQTRTKTVTDWYPISGHIDRYFDDRLVPASESPAKKEIGKIDRFSTKTLRVYDPAFLAGFSASRYSVGLVPGFESIKGELQSHMESAVRAHEGYDTYRMMSYQHRYRKVAFKHILLPVWISSFRFKEKPYTFCVNGENGLCAGRAPVSPLKVTLTVLLSLALIAGIVLLVVSLAGGGGAVILPPTFTLSLTVTEETLPSFFVPDLVSGGGGVWFSGLPPNVL